MLCLEHSDLSLNFLVTYAFIRENGLLKVRKFLVKHFDLGPLLLLYSEHSRLFTECFLYTLKSQPIYNDIRYSHRDFDHRIQIVCKGETLHVISRFCSPYR